MKEKKSKYTLTPYQMKGKGIVEDATEYGEFIASFDAWLTPEEQKRRARHLENIEKEEE